MNIKIEATTITSRSDATPPAGTAHFGNVVLLLRDISLVESSLGMTLVLTVMAGASDTKLDTSVSAAMRSSAFWYLSSGSFSRVFNIIASSSSGHSSTESRMGFGVSLTCPLNISKVLFPEKGTDPVTSSYIRQPREYRSLLGSISATWICSGDIYRGVPIVEPVLVMVDMTSAAAIPKSVSFIPPSSFMRTFAGLISRCVMP